MYDALRQPVTIAGLTVPNRIVRTAHSLGKPWVDVDDALVAYHEARALGGVGLSILETARVLTNCAAHLQYGEGFAGPAHNLSFGGLKKTMRALEMRH